MKTALEPDEEIKKEGRANVQRGLETVGGHLYLTDLRLVFEPHEQNVQIATITLYLSDVKSIKAAWTKFLSFIPVAPNSLKVSLGSGEDYKFVLSDRSHWASSITDACKARSVS